MAVVQGGYPEMRAEPKHVVELRKKVLEVFTKCDYRCTCGAIDYDILHPRTSTTGGDVQVNCKRCGQKRYFDEERLSKFVGKHDG